MDTFPLDSYKPFGLIYCWSCGWEELLFFKDGIYYKLCGEGWVLVEVNWKKDFKYD